jgi:hypothetical protein
MWLSRKKPHVIIPPDVLCFEAQAQASDRETLVSAWEEAIHP